MSNNSYNNEDDINLCKIYREVFENGFPQAEEMEICDEDNHFYQTSLSYPTKKFN